MRQYIDWEQIRAESIVNNMNPNISYDGHHDWSDFYYGGGGGGSGGGRSLGGQAATMLQRRITNVMNRIEFEKFVKETLIKLITYTEVHFDDKLPTEICLRWSVNKENIIDGTDKVVDDIVEKVYISEDQIYPCVDLVVIDKINDQKILIEGSIAGYKPTHFQTGWSNRPGPFIYGLDPKFVNPKINTNSIEFKNKLKELKLLY